VVQTLETKARAKTLTLDTKTDRIVVITTEPMPAPAGEPPAAPAAPAAKKGGNTGPAFLDLIAIGR
jgi:hypothetical protein